MRSKEGMLRQKFLSAIRNEGGMAIAVETKTQVGVPDIFFVFNDGTQGWIELKVVSKTFNETESYHDVPWRPGQQTFALTYYSLTQRPVICYVVFNNGSYVVDTTLFYPENKVPTTKFTKVTGILTETLNISIK